MTRASGRVPTPLGPVTVEWQLPEAAGPDRSCVVYGEVRGSMNAVLVLPPPLWGQVQELDAAGVAPLGNGAYRIVSPAFRLAFTG